jgi:hypothetical protein
VDLERLAVARRRLLAAVLPGERHPQVGEVSGRAGPQRQGLAVGGLRLGKPVEGRQSHAQVVQVLRAQGHVPPCLVVSLDRAGVVRLAQARFGEHPPCPGIVGVVVNNLPEQPLGLRVRAVAVVLPRKGQTVVRHGIRSREFEMIAGPRRRPP